MSLGFRCLLIVLICFFALWVYHKREGQLSIWMGLSQPPPAEHPQSPAPFSGIVGNDTVIETTIKPAPFFNGRQFRVPRSQSSPWKRRSIAAAEPGSEEFRRRSANLPGSGEQVDTGEGVGSSQVRQVPGPQQATGAVEVAEPLRLVNPPATETVSGEDQQAAASAEAPVPQPLPPQPPRVSYRFHKVKDGDNLWNLASNYLGAGHKFPQIIELNEKLRENPGNLRLGMELKIPPKR